MKRQFDFEHIFIFTVQQNYPLDKRTQIQDQNKEMKTLFRKLAMSRLMKRSEGSQGVGEKPIEGWEIQKADF